MASTGGFSAGPGAANKYLVTPSGQKVGSAVVPKPVTQSVLDLNNFSGGGNPQPIPQPSGGGGGGNTQPQVDPYAQIKADISSAWDNYIGSLNDIGNTYLPQQQTAQTNIADTQLATGQQQLNDQKAKSLRDIASNTKNAFQAANVFLGARGAGDSSAANQYSFAIQQDTNKQVGQLNEFVNGQMRQLQSDHDTQIQSIANWFAQQQQAIKQAVASGQLSKQQDINNLSKGLLDQAIAATNQVKADASNRYNALLEWAANNSQNVGQLQQNIAAIPQVLGQAQVDSTGGYVLPTGYGYNNDQKKTDIFGRPIG